MSMLTIGDIRREIAGLHDDCHVEILVQEKSGPCFGHAMIATYCENDNDGEGGWLTILVEDQ